MSRGRIAEQGDLEHGRSSTYINWDCRCTPCVEAHNVEVDRQREDRLRRSPIQYLDRYAKHSSGRSDS